MQDAKASNPQSDANWKAIINCVVTVVATSLCHFVSSMLIFILSVFKEIHIVDVNEKSSAMLEVI